MWISLWKESENILGFDPKYTNGVSNLMSVFHFMIEEVLREFKDKKVEVCITVETKGVIKNV